MNVTTNKYTPEMRDRAVRMVLDTRREDKSRGPAIASKIGCAPQTLNDWGEKVEVDTGRPLPGDHAEWAARLERGGLVP